MGIPNETDPPADAAAPADAPPATGDGTGGEEGRVPLDRFQKVTSENKELRAQLDALAAEKAEREAAEMSELEKERKAREAAEAAAAAAAERATTLERNSWITSAASAAGFADPADAVALLSGEEVGDAASAAALVKGLGEKKPHLLAASGKGPKPLGTPLGGNAATGKGGKDEDPKVGLGNDILTMLRGGS
jgi:hypothetical protein